jgi:NADH-ubiquinone oxidoreductase chain 5
VDQVANEVIVFNLMNFGYASSFQALDKGLIERVGPAGFTNYIFNTSTNFVGFNSGFLFNTIFFLIASSFFVFLFYIASF